MFGVCLAVLNFAWFKGYEAESLISLKENAIVFLQEHEIRWRKGRNEITCTNKETREVKVFKCEKKGFLVRDIDRAKKDYRLWACAICLGFRGKKRKYFKASREFRSGFFKWFISVDKDGKEYLVCKNRYNRVVMDIDNLPMEFLMKVTKNGGKGRKMSETFDSFYSGKKKCSICMKKITKSEACDNVDFLCSSCKDMIVRRKRK